MNASAISKGSNQRGRGITNEDFDNIKNIDSDVSRQIRTKGQSKDYDKNNQSKGNEFIHYKTKFKPSPPKSPNKSKDLTRNNSQKQE